MKSGYDICHHIDDYQIFATGYSPAIIGKSFLDFNIRSDGTAKVMYCLVSEHTVNNVHVGSSSTPVSHGSELRHYTPSAPTMPKEQWLRAVLLPECARTGCLQLRRVSAICFC